MKKFEHFLNILMGSFVGVFVGNSVYRVWNYHANPALYGMQSVPWYTSILVDGAFTVLFLLLVLTIKWILRVYRKRHESK